MVVGSAVAAATLSAICVSPPHSEEMEKTIVRE